MKRKIYTRPVTVILESNVFEKIEKMADEKCLSFSDIIRSAIEQYLENIGEK